MGRRIACLVAVLLAAGMIFQGRALRSRGPAPAASGSAPQAQNDPLTEDEVQQIRDNAIHPDERIRLYMKFIGQRLEAIRQLVADRDAPNRAAEIRAKLEEFTSLCDEIQDNLDTYDSDHADIRKSLKDLVAASGRWPDFLRGLPANPTYEFSQKTAVEAAQSASDEAKHLTTEQDVYFDVHKKERHGNGTAPD